VVKGTYDLGGISSDEENGQVPVPQVNPDKDTPDEENGPVPVPQVNPDKDTPDEENGPVAVPQVNPNKGVPFKHLRDVLTLMNTYFSENNLCSTPFISLAALVKASETIYDESLDSISISQEFRSFIYNVYENPTLVSKFETEAGMVKVFKKWCNHHDSNGVKFLVSFFNENKNEIKEMCNKTFLEVVQQEMPRPGQPKILRRNPAKRLMHSGMVNTLKAVTKGPYDTLLCNLISTMKEVLHDVSDIEQIKKVVCDLYKKFMEDLKADLWTKRIKVKEGRWYNTSQSKIDFDDQFNRVKNGLGNKLRTKLSMETRSKMIEELEKLMRDIFNS